MVAFGITLLHKKVLGKIFLTLWIINQKQITMEALGAISGFIAFISFIIGILVFIAIISIADNTKKTNKLLRLMLNEQNPERFTLSFGKIRDSATGKKL